MAETANIQAEAPVEERAAEQAGMPPSTSGTAILRDRFLIDGGSPLPHLNSPSALAFTAFDREAEDPGIKLFALICMQGMPVRTELMSRLKDARHPGLLPLIEWGPMDWPDSPQRVMAVVFEQPLGGRLTDALEAKKTKINEYDVVRRVVEPAMSGISLITSIGKTNRAIRPDNLFFMDEDCHEIVLGDCVTTSAAFDQPTVFETITRSAASPAGRGVGSVHDDLYSLGVTLVFILLGFNPVANVGELDLLSMKIERGSYATVCGNSRLPLSMIELLRGLLNDDEATRWGLEEISTWISGRKRTPIQRRGLPKANAPYMFQGHAHVSPLTLAYSFARNPEEALRTLKSDETFVTWLRKNLNDEELADRFTVLMEQASAMAGSSAVAEDALMTRICMLLDPAGPIRFGGLALMPDALAAELAVEMTLRNNIEPLKDLISRELFAPWFKSAVKPSAEMMPWLRSFSQCRSYLKIDEIGYGIERCLYEFNPGMPCQSPLVAAEFIAYDEELLGALDRASNRVEPDARPVDRHIGAFIAARFNENIDPHLKAIAAPEEERQIIGTLSLLAFLQWKLKTPAVLGLASWIGGLLGPAINTYHSRSTRRELEKSIPQLVRKGSLPELFDLIDNAERRQLDASGFEEAQNAFMKAEDEIYEIEGAEGERESRILKSGQKTTAMLSILLCMIVVTMLFLLETWQG